MKGLKEIKEIIDQIAHMPESGGINHVTIVSVVAFIVIAIVVITLTLAK